MFCVKQISLFFLCIKLFTVIELVSSGWLSHLNEAINSYEMTIINCYKIINYIYKLNYKYNYYKREILFNLHV